MELTQIEVARIEEVSRKSSEEQVRELNDLQLALVGGGGGDVIFF